MKDNQQPHPQFNGAATPGTGQDILGPLLFHFTPDQKQLLQGLLAQSASKILAIQFNEPEQDALRLRQHSYCYGAVDAITAIIEYDKNALEQEEEKMRLQEGRDNVNSEVAGF